MAAILRRTPEPAISRANAWDDDPFERKNEGDILCKLIASCLDEPLVISLQSPWGSGKTVFLKRVAAHIEAAYAIPAIRIDAWKSDDCNDPLATIIGELAHVLAAHKTKPGVSAATRKEIDDTISKLARFGSRLFLPGLSVAADVAAPGSGAAMRAAGAYGEKLLAAQKEKRDAEVDFRKTLEVARDLITGKQKAGRLKPLLLIIDELDRCRPDHAIRMLERIKHYFDVQAITFLIATDHGNLPSAVKTVYGQHVDGELYLRKFFDYEFHLKEPSPVAFAHLLVNRNLYPNTALVDCKSAFGGYRSLPNIEKQPDYVIDDQTTKFEYATCFASFSSVMNLSLRDQTQAISILSAFINTHPKHLIKIPIIDCFIACFRFGSPARFKKYLSTGDISTHYDATSQDAPAMSALVGSRIYDLVAKALSFKYADPEEDGQLLTTLRQIGSAKEFDDDRTVLAAVLSLRLRKLKCSAGAYMESVSRLANAFSDAGPTSADH